MDDYEREEARLLALYDEVATPPGSPEESDNDSDDDSIADVDYHIVSDHETDTEQESLSEEDEEDESSTRSKFYFGKDKTKWRKQAPPLNVRTRNRNIVTHLPGILGAAKDAKSPIECWNLFFEDIVQIIVFNTNLYIRKVAPKYKDSYDTKETTVEEIRALIGLLYLAGSQHGGRKNLSEFYGDDGLGCEMFPAVMAQRRLKFLLRCLRFDNTDTREERKSQDNLAAVREMTTKFNELCKTHYSIGEYATLDEMLLAFRGRCRFKMYIPNKPNKYGLKLFSLVDARTFYTHHLEIYAGTQPDGPFKTDNSTGAVTERMCNHLFGSGRNITMDRWFTGTEIVSRLLRERLTVVGTIRANKRQLPPELTQVKNRPVLSSIFAFGIDMMGVSYVPKKSKNVLLVSSMHNDDKIDETTGEKKKPEIVTFYNLTKGGVDVVDRMITAYNVARNTRRWPMVHFYGLVNVAAINAFIVYRANNSHGEFRKSRRLFLKSLGTNLAKQYMQQRATSKYLPRKVRESASRLSGVAALEEHQDPPPTKRGYCKYCKRRKTRFFCKFCKCWLCMEHIVACCNECADRN